jgi:DNA-binding NtrC family response regulator
LEKFQAGKFDLVIVDRAMPEMNGDELAVAIKQREPNMPVAMLTGFGDLMGAGHEKPENVDYIVSKPITLTVFRKTLVKVTTPSKSDESKPTTL